MKKGLLIVLSGPSGVGKGTLREKLFLDHGANLVYSISMTSRLPRNKEVEGEHYYFVSKEEFLNRIENKDMLEYAEFVGNFYGTPKSYVEQMRSRGFDVILEIEVEGAKQIRKNVDDAVFIFIVPPSFEELERRIKGRGTESIEIIQERLDKAKREMHLISEYDYVVENQDVDKAVEDINNIINKERRI